MNTEKKKRKKTNPKLGEALLTDAMLTNPIISSTEFTGCAMSSGLISEPDVIYDESGGFPTLSDDGRKISADIKKHASDDGD